MKKSMIGLATLGALLAFVLTACSGGASPADKANMKAQTALMNAATTQVPVPHVDNFIARKNLAEYMRRMDNPNEVWYVYLLGDNGNIIGYQVGTYPQSVCTFMTPPEKAVSLNGGNNAVAVPAPGLDGVYYGAGGCNSSFMFDKATGAMIFIGGLKFLAYDKPIDVKASPITFQNVQKH